MVAEGYRKGRTAELSGCTVVNLGELVLGSMEVEGMTSGVEVLSGVTGELRIRPKMGNRDDNVECTCLR